MRKNQATNLPLTASPSVVSFDGGATGSTDTAVLLFTSSVASGEGVAVVDSATAGTVITITAPGLYACELGFIVANGDVTYGLSLNQSANLVNDPSFATGGVLVVLANNGVGASVNTGCNFSTVVAVDRTRAYQPGGSVLRFLATDSNDGAPAAIVAGTGWYKVRKIAECYF